jgi:hypothetical protein
MLKFWFFFLCGTALFATVNEPLRWEVFSVYRNDRIHWHLQDPGDSGELLYRELYRDVQYWENGLTLKVIHRDLIFFLRGAYGAFGRGNVYQRYASEPSEDPRFQFNTDGWTADGSGYFGYAVNLTADRTYKVLFTPLIGYAGYFECLSRKNGTPEPFISETPAGASFTMFSALPADYRLVWYGFLFGGGFTVEPGNGLVLNAGYSYHLLRLRQHSNFQNQILIGTPTFSDLSTISSLTAKDGGGKGHSGWAQLDFAVSRFWRAGLGGQIHYFFSNVTDVKVHQQTQGIIPFSPSSQTKVPEKFKLRWTSFSGWIQISREF